MGTVVQLICGLLVPSTDYALPALIKIFIAPKRFQHVWLAYNFLSDWKTSLLTVVKVLQLNRRS